MAKASLRLELDWGDCSNVFVIETAVRYEVVARESSCRVGMFGQATAGDSRRIHEGMPGGATADAKEGCSAPIQMTTYHASSSSDVRKKQFRSRGRDAVKCVGAEAMSKNQY